jgi:hypothetical protein
VEVVMTDRDPTDDPEVAKERVMHDAQEAIKRLYETIPPQDAHWIATVAIIAADRDYRKRQNNG